MENPTTAIARPGSGQRTSNELRFAGQRDPLTGLFEQDYLIQELERTLQKSRTQPVTATLALMQLENFYEIRTWVGKPEADLLLSDIAHLLEKSLPESVILCRWQHYEFAVLLFNESSLNARLITDRVKQALQSALSTSIPPQLELKCGVGLTAVDRNIPSVEVLFARARHKLSLAHYRGENNVQLTALAATSPGIVLKQLHKALRNHQLQLSFQPTVSLREDGLQHYEIRSFLPGENYSLPTPLLFETAVQNALGENIDRYIIGQALQLLRRQNQNSLRLTVNLTQNTVVSPHFFDWLETTIHQHSDLGEQLVFQISEIDVLIAQHHMDYFCNQLARLNIKLSISNFGCTPDPFRYLSLLRAHFVKLDVSLLEKIDVDPVKRDQLIQIIARLHQNGLRAIAGMVENMSLLPWLWKARVNFVQGYCMQKPESSLNFEFLKDETVGLH